MKTTINITVETNLQYIVIEKQFDLSFIPFYDMVLSYDNGTLALSNNHLRKSVIYYNMNQDSIRIEVRDDVPFMPDELVILNITRGLNDGWKILEDKNNIMKQI